MESLQKTKVLSKKSIITSGKQAFINIKSLVDKKNYSAFDKKLLLEFGSWLNTNSPFGRYNPENPHIKFFPFKPFIFIAILKSVDKENFLNKTININSSEILSYYYSLFSNNYDFMQSLKGINTYKEWFFDKYSDEIMISSWNKQMSKRVLQQIYQNPLAEDKLKNCAFVETSKASKTIRFLMEFNNKKQKDLHGLLLKICDIVLKKCLTDYSKTNYDIEEILKVYSSNDNPTQNRKGQQIWAKYIKEKYQKCVFCGIDAPDVLEAAHIKDYSVCEKDERFHKNNGVTLCRNHHKLFDAGYFKFTGNGKIDKAYSSTNRPDLVKLIDIFLTDLSKTFKVDSEFFQFEKSTYIKRKRLVSSY